VVVRLNENGHLAELVPNAVLGLKVKPVDGRRLQLVWSYCPLDQETEPEVFRMYTDSGTGQWDWDNPIATMAYEGRKFYRHETGALPDGSHQFAVVAERADQTQIGLLSVAGCLIQHRYCESPEVLAMEAIS
jgi:hypothetical protein